MSARLLQQVLAAVTLCVAQASVSLAQTSAVSAPSPSRDAVAATSKPDARPTNFLGITVRQAGIGRIIVDQVEPNSAADRAGIQVGDQILSVAHMPAESVTAFEKSLVGRKPAEPMEISFTRKDKIYNIEITAHPPAAGSAGKTTEPTGQNSKIETSNILGMHLKQTEAGKIVIEKVSPDTPAAEAGIQPGDELVTFAGHVASPLKDLIPFAVKIVKRDEPGKPIAVELARGGQAGTVQIGAVKQVAGASGNAQLQQTTSPQMQASTVIGLTLRDIPPNIVTVVDVAPNSPADIAGLKPSDIIASVDRQPTATSQEFMGLIGAHRIGDSVELQVTRNEKPFLSNLPLMPRVIDIAGLAAQETILITGQEFQTLHQQIYQLRQQVEVLQQMMANSHQGAQQQPGPQQAAAQQQPMGR